MNENHIWGVSELGKILVASAWPYVNFIPHLGTVIQCLSADVVARYYRSKGEDVLMVSGSDEHGTPAEVEALRIGISPKQLTDQNHAKIVELFKKWGFSFNNYTRTENPVHREFVREHLMKIYNNGYIFTQETDMLYCEECRRFLPDRFVEGTCPQCGYTRARGDQCDTCGRLLEPVLLIEPYCVICKSKPVVKRTKHWYFDLSKFSKQLDEYLSRNEQLPNNAKNFSLNLVKEGLKPRAVTRDVTWGIPAPFPGAENKTVYVWVEAVLGYISAAIEYFKKADQPEKWKGFWFNKDAKTLFFIGKDNIPFHTLILPALLLASGEDYNLPTNVSTTEFIQFKGKKASKSQKVGLWIDEALELFPVDYWRFFLMATRPEAKDSDFSWEVFIEKINADLNDTFGNFIHRTLSFLNKQFDSKIPDPENLDGHAKEVLEILKQKVNAMAQDIEACRLQSAANSLINIGRLGNQYLNEKEPWKLVKQDKQKAGSIFYVTTQIVKTLAILSAPFLPGTAEEIWKTLNLSGNVHEQKWEETLLPLPSDHQIAVSEPLFRKIEANTEDLDEKLQKLRENTSSST